MVSGYIQAGTGQIQAAEKALEKFEYQVTKLAILYEQLNFQFKTQNSC